MDKYILLVEDSPDDIALTELALKKARIGNRLEIARDGQEALNFLSCKGKFAGRDIADRPAVILLDLKLPKVNGLEVLAGIRSGRGLADTPVVILTSSMEANDQSESLRLGPMAISASLPA